MAESRNSADIMTTSTEDDDANKSSAQTPTTQLPSSHETSRKRKRLSAVLDKLATQIERRSLDSSSSEDASPPSSAAPAPHGGPQEPADKPRSKMRAPPQKQVSLDSEMGRCVETKLDLLDPPIAPRRSPTPPPDPQERRRRTGGSGDCSAVPFSPNRPSFTPPASSEGGSTPPNAAADDVFSPPRGDRSARPPAPALEPLRILPEGYPDHRLLRPPTTPLPHMGNGASVATALTFPGFPACDCPHCRTLAGRAPFWEGGSPLLQKVMSGGGPLTPVSPLTPSFDAFLQAKFLPEFYKRRSHSDSDLQQCLTEAALGRHHHAPQDEKRHPTARRPEPLRLPQKGGSLESDQDSPLDLSVKSNGSSNPDTNHSGSSPTRFPLSPLELPDSPVRTATSSPTSFASATRIDATTTTTTTTVVGGASARKNVVEVSNSDVAYACPVCGQMFSLHDRLAKHMASRHRGRHRPSPDTTTSSTIGASKSYTCEVCGRSFARSDMLTRHVRLHTGVKPYTCRACGQVFSRSDHLSTHQRTHTGEKPYRCPQCPYAACRRDMITRHMRTHARCELPDSSSGMLVDDRASPLQHLKLGSPGRVEMAKD